MGTQRETNMPIVRMGKFTAIGMRQKVTDPQALVINTCGQNDQSGRGSPGSWAWCNPTNRALSHPYHDVVAVSVECLWQGTKLLPGMSRPDPDILAGAWRKHKGRAPAGAYAGPGQDLIRDPGAARRAIYLPAFQRLVDHWLNNDDQVLEWVEQAARHHGDVYLRDHDTGRGLDRRGPMSHAWVLASYLNTMQWPT